MRSLARIAALAGALAGLAPIVAANAQKSADTLRVAWRDQVADIDPYYNNMRTGLVVAHQAWDTLVYRDPDGFVMKPLLATSWKWIDDVTLDFELRPGVTFHNGDPFTVDDVLYTVGIITDPKSQISVPSNFIWLAGAEAAGENHVRLKLKQAFPAALEFVSFVMPIYPKAYRERVGADAYAKAPVGSGPYRITKVDGVNEINFERYEGYYAGSAKGRPPIRRLVIKEVQDSSTELTMILGGQADWIWQFNPDQFDRIAAMPGLTTIRQEAMRIAHLTIDAAGRTGANNPLTDPRVRRAIFYAIDRQTFARQLVQGGSRVPDAPCYFTQFGCDMAAAVHYDYDPVKAKALLAEAGYPNGFDTELDTSMLPQWAGAIQNYLGAVGIRAKVNQMQSAAVTQRMLAGQTPLYFSSWGSYSINDVSAIIPYFFDGGPVDYARDPEVIRLVKEGGSVTDPTARKQAYDAAIHRITEQAYWLPIATYVTTYAISRQLNFTAYPDELPRYFLSSWK
jgi:peptide/nickel transport system substrate-binding protein